MTYYHSDDRVQAFDSGLVMLIGLAMLLAPIWILNAVKATDGRLGIITVFVTAFLLLLQVVTAAKPSETLAATAAYVPTQSVATAWRRKGEENRTLHNNVN